MTAELDASRNRQSASLSVWDLAYRLARHTATGHGDQVVLLNPDPYENVLDEQTRRFVERYEWAASGTQVLSDGSDFTLMEFIAHPIDAIPTVPHRLAPGQLRSAVARSVAGLLLTVALWLTRPRAVRVNAKEPTMRELS